MDFPIKVSQLKSPSDPKDLIDRLVKCKLTSKPMYSQSNPRQSQEQELNNELRLENSMLKKKIVQLECKLEELERQLKPTTQIQEEMIEESHHTQFQEEVGMSEEEQSLQFAIQLQQQEQMEFNNRLFMLQNQVDPDEMTYEELNDLEEKMGFVSRGLSKEKIQRVLNEWKIVGECNEFCTICLEESGNPVEIQLQCNHVFHQDCIEEWLNREKHCPVCKREIKLENMTI